MGVETRSSSHSISIQNVIDSIIEQWCVHLTLCLKIYGQMWNFALVSFSILTTSSSGWSSLLPKGDTFDWWKKVSQELAFRQIQYNFFYINTLLENYKRRSFLLNWSGALFASCSATFRSFLTVMWDFY